MVLCLLVSSLSKPVHMHSNLLIKKIVLTLPLQPTFSLTAGSLLRPPEEDDISREKTILMMSLQASASEKRVISTTFPPFPLNRVDRSLGTSMEAFLDPQGKEREQQLGVGGERIGSPKNFTWKTTLVLPFYIHFDLRWHINIFIATIKLENQNLVH